MLFAVTKLQWSGVAFLNQVALRFGQPVDLLLAKLQPEMQRECAGEFLGSGERLASKNAFKDRLRSMHLFVWYFLSQSA